jgi:hypothetical protein
VICGLSCGFIGQGSERLLGRGAPVLTVTGPCFWHGCGTDLRCSSHSRASGSEGPGMDVPLPCWL